MSFIRRFLCISSPFLQPVSRAKPQVTTIVVRERERERRKKKPQQQQQQQHRSTISVDQQNPHIVLVEPEPPVVEEGGGEGPLEEMDSQRDKEEQDTAGTAGTRVRMYTVNSL